MKSLHLKKYEAPSFGVIYVHKYVGLLFWINFWTLESHHIFKNLGPFLLDEIYVGKFGSLSFWIYF
jgi:hypothetical protein